MTSWKNLLIAVVVVVVVVAVAARIAPVRSLVFGPLAPATPAKK